MSEEKTETVPRQDVVRMAVDIVAAYVAQNNANDGQIPDIILQVFGTLSELSAAPAETGKKSGKPMVSVRRSVTPDFIICLEDGRKLKMLKRHLRTAYNLTPEEYRSRWNLPPDYPMVAPNYAKRRSDFAKKIGLGRKSA